MKDDDKIRLKANHKFLVSNLSVEGIQDYLYEKGVLTLEEAEDLEAERTSTRQARRLLITILPKKDNNAYNILLDALNDIGNADYIVKRLRDTNVENFRESDYEGALHEEDKLKRLQNQMFLQTELLTQAKKEIDDLKSRVHSNEQESSALNNKYSELEETMAQKGLTEGHVVNILTDYLSSTDIPDMANARFASPLPSPSRPVKPAGPVFSFSDSDISSKQQEKPCQAIAREMGRDIVKYVVQKALKKPPSKPRSNYCATMRRLVDELYAKWEDLFDNFISKLNMSQITGYETFISVADEIFREGDMNWGRIVVLYAFAGYVARHCVENGVEKIVEFMGDFLGFYVVKMLGPWINENGGWDGFLEKFNAAGEDGSTESAWKGALWTALGIGVGLGATVAYVAARNT